MDGEEKQVTVVKNATDLQRLRLEKLMKNPEKLAFIPDPPKDKKFSDPAEFVRNVMGSSAGAGSGEFHVYRHIRRREYARQEFLQSCKEKDDLDREYCMRIENNRQAVEDKATKKRLKRQRWKERQRAKRQKQNAAKPEESSSSESSEEEQEEKNEGEEKQTAENLGNKQNNEKQTEKNSGNKGNNEKQVGEEGSKNKSKGKEETGSKDAKDKEEEEQGKAGSPGKNGGNDT